MHTWVSLKISARTESDTFRVVSKYFVETRCSMMLRIAGEVVHLQRMALRNAREGT